ncbi:recombinase RmuC [Idiomarina sp. MD25a]|uniref:DNA recombination protein RmuC n=1 Tax=Idiomarina sp. MD25a TaxID=1889913 RepID=UPI0008F82E3D|nr:DNA recombination protein RmuC [Idiomarina sp. MD25a]OIN01778.1 recombinase RmuC [Idiomarina sp. MD25a]
MLNDMMTMSTTIWVVLLFVATLAGVAFAVLWRTQVKRADALSQTVDEQTEQLGHLRERLHYTESQWQTLRATAAQERRASEDKLHTLEAAEQRMAQQFENLANRIFEQRSNQMQQQHQQSLQATLAPFKQQLESFKQQVQQQHSDETKERAALRSELLSLKTLNQQMAQEADALTRALKGDNKHQGNWGEVVLERILQQSGLREGHEYDTQSSFADDDGKRLRPDVIVHLPNERDVVIDSKVSLSAYERYFNSDDEAVRKQALNEHVQSLRQHIKQLGKKNYQQLQGIKTLDYVLLFVPIEPAFLLAVDKDPELIKLALDEQIMLVSPTNLLVALRTIHNIWQYEHQNQNAQHIAAEAGKLYDKFVGFVEDLDKIGAGIHTLEQRYQDAMKKLSQGRGNLLTRVEKFRTMGVQTSKQLSATTLHKEADNEASADD